MNFLLKRCIKTKVLLRALGLFIMVPTFSHSSSFELTSSTFTHEGEIPLTHTCEGSDLSPHLVWKNAPAGAQSFVIICYDPDAPDPAAPKMTYYHWLLFNIPADTTNLTEGIANVPTGTKVGKNSHGDQKFKGPCPPIGRHRYFFELYALDIKELGLEEGADQEALHKAMGGSKAGEGHILDKTVLMGTYQKQKK
jgi:Raf kinase inhibitor-like YbhB/YbcL family protein